MKNEEFLVSVNETSKGEENEKEAIDESESESKLTFWNYKKLNTIFFKSWGSNTRASKKCSSRIEK